MAQGIDVKTCIFFVKKRGRTCRMCAVKGSDFCGEHLIFDDKRKVRLDLKSKTADELAYI